MRIPAFSLLLFIVSAMTSAYASTNHEIVATINPATHHIAVIDKVLLAKPVCQEELIVSLHSELHPKVTAPAGARLTFKQSEVISDLHKLKIDHYSLTLPCNTQSVTFEYSGAIYHPVTDADDSSSRGAADTPGLISEEGVVLSAGTHWYPQFENIEDSFVTFSMQTEAPLGWTVVSQGQRLLSNRWEETSPQQDIYLIAAQFTEYEKTLPGGLKISAFLRTKDDELATRYLDVTSGYIERYSALIGPYPYAKFALIENFWDTGFGMPSFTLLGSNIIRLPFIIISSYPHEILHDWWGNGVYVDYPRGNWCEGITVYLADHLMAELAGTGDSYRRDSIQKYTDFVNNKNDFPLNQFIERRDPPTEAIGYGKASLFFHMLRRQVGDQNFKAAFALFYDKNKFKEVSYREIREAFEAVSGQSLKAEFDQWVDRKGAPELKISDVTTTPDADGFLFHAKIEQVQKDEPFALNLPIAIHLEGHPVAIQKTLKMNARTLEINLRFATRAVWFQVDPEFDIFRRLGVDEVPPVLTMALGAEKVLMVLPANAAAETIANWKNFINTIRPELPEGSDVQVVLDTELNVIPTDRSIWVLGKNNLLTKKFQSLVMDQGVQINQDDLVLEGLRKSFANNSFTLIGRDPKANQIWTFVATESEASFPILANKLIHYGKYSFLGFEGKSVTNKQKGIWKLLSSSMSVPAIQNDGAEVSRTQGKLIKRNALVAP